MSEPETTGDGVTPKPALTLRWIDGPTATDAEWSTINKVLAARGWMTINRETSRVRVAERAGELMGFYVLQMVPHAEPMWVRPSERATGLADQLADDMQQFLVDIRARGWMIVADSPYAAKMCEERGMRKVESPVYVKVGD